MMPLTQYQRSTVINLLEQQEAFAQPVSFLSALNMGITEPQIRLIDYLSRTLRKSPRTSMVDLLTNGISCSDVICTIGSLEQFKHELGIKCDCASDWLTVHSTSHQSAKGIVIPYEIYRRFFDEIKRFYSEKNKLKAGLFVELDLEVSYSCVTLSGAFNSLIPATDDDALHLVASLLVDDYLVLNIDKAKSQLLVRKVSTNIVSLIEVRCLASALTQRTLGGVCVYDDIGLTTSATPNYLVCPLRRLIDKHHSKYAHHANARSFKEDEHHE
ncbi:hypothetical protein [Shewanella gaetbuli]